VEEVEQRAQKMPENGHQRAALESQMSLGDSRERRQGREPRLVRSSSAGVQQGARGEVVKSDSMREQGTVEAMRELAMSKRSGLDEVAQEQEVALVRSSSVGEQGSISRAATLISTNSAGEHGVARAVCELGRVTEMVDGELDGAWSKAQRAETETEIENGPAGGVHHTRQVWVQALLRALQTQGWSLQQLVSEWKKSSVGTPVRHWDIDVWFQAVANKAASQGIEHIAEEIEGDMPVGQLEFEAVMQSLLRVAAGQKLNPSDSDGSEDCRAASPTKRTEEMGKLMTALQQRGWALQDLVNAWKAQYPTSRCGWDIDTWLTNIALQRTNAAAIHLEDRMPVERVDFDTVLMALMDIIKSNDEFDKDSTSPKKSAVVRAEIKRHQRDSAHQLSLANLLLENLISHR